MCQDVDKKSRYYRSVRPTAELEKERTCWKVVSRKNPGSGVYYNTKFRRDGWAKSEVPKHDGYVTYRGYHVFSSKIGAEKYRENFLWGTSLYYKVIKVQVRGKVIPFLNYPDNTPGMSNCKSYKGFAVQSWRPKEKK